MIKKRCRWSQKEDAVLKAVIRRKCQSNQIDWEDIATYVPGRSSSECFKHWQLTVSSSINTGTWSPAEDEWLKEAVSKYGTRWVVVAAEVGTRNGEQCAKRWNENLNPELDHSPWTPEEDDLLLSQVDAHGKNWKFIANTAFEARASLALKNRYSLLMRRRNRLSAKPASLSKPSSIDSSPIQIQRQDANVTIRERSATSSPNCASAAMDKSLDANLDHSSVYSEVPSTMVEHGYSQRSNRLSLFDGVVSDNSNVSLTDWSHHHGWADMMSSEALPLAVPISDDVLFGDMPVCDDFQMCDTVPPPPVASCDLVDQATEFSITCQRGRLKSMVHHIVDVAAPGGSSDGDEVTLTLRFKTSC